MKNLEKEKQELEQRLKEINQELEKPKLEIDKWYVLENSNGYKWVINFQGDINDNNYGFWDNEWRTDLNLNEACGFKRRPATHEEVEQALTKEAEKRYKSGDKIKCLADNVTELIEPERRLYLENNELWCETKERHFIVFKDGKWAEIIEEPKVFINGFEMEMPSVNRIKFGCAIFCRHHVQELNEKIKIFNSGVIDEDYLDMNRKIKSIKLDSGVEITIDQLKQIVNQSK